MSAFNPDVFVWLVDRTTLGGTEIVYDGQRIVFKPDEIKKYVPRDLVLWLYRTDKARVWTKDGAFVHRFAVEDPPAWLLDRCGPEVGDTAPIEVDASRLEGWDTSGVVRDEKTRVQNLNIPASEFRERQAAGAHIATR